MRRSDRLAMLLCAPAIAVIVAGASIGHAGSEQRTLVVRERASASLLDGAVELKVLKMRGYSIDVRISGKKRVLKLGQSFSPEGSDCSVIFEEISPETRIARFKTDCP